MICKKAIKWMALYREGELEPEIHERLRKHLTECASCAQIFKTFKKYNQETEKIRAYHPVPDNMDLISKRILDTLADMKKSPDETAVLNIAGRFADFIMLPPARRIALASILVIVLSFGFQQYTTYSRISKLENQLSAAGKTFLSEAQNTCVEDCLRKSAHFARSRARHRKAEKTIQQHLIENPEKMKLYVSLICNRQYNALEKYINQDKTIIDNLITIYQPEIK